MDERCSDLAALGQRGWKFCALALGHWLGCRVLGSCGLALYFGNP